VITGVEAIVTNPTVQGSIPSGELERATFMWHANSRQWILGHSESDREAPAVGGCGGGPHVVDFTSKIIWTCEGGP
jgi:hypothetical protein